MIQISNLVKSYNNRIILNIDQLIINDGDKVGILGANGSGKSTLLSIISGLKCVDSGLVNIDGLNYKENRHEIAKLIGLMPQYSTLTKRVTVQQALMDRAGIFGISREQATILTQGIMDIFYLSKFKDIYASSLSGGTVQRVMAACALITKPKILILDEPTTGVDAVTRNIIWDYIDQSITSKHILLISSHSKEEIQRLAQYCLLIKDSKVIKLPVEQAFEIYERQN